MILLILLTAFAIVGVFIMAGVAEAQNFDRGVKPLEVIERYAKRTVPTMLLAVGTIAAAAIFAPQTAQPPTDSGVILLMMLLPIGAIGLSFARLVIPAMTARMARDTARLERLLKIGVKTRF